MKKRDQISGESSDTGEIFPVDTLGIPILVDVVESVTFPDPDKGPEISAENSGTESEPPDTRPISDRKHSIEATSGVLLDQITDQITNSVTEEIMANLKPIVRDKVLLALRTYENALRQLPEEESEENPESD